MGPSFFSAAYNAPTEKKGSKFHNSFAITFYLSREVNINKQTEFVIFN